jgi:hypothetical protein
LEIEPARESLVGKCGIGKSVAEHHDALLQRRQDTMRDMLASRSENQQRFGLRCDWFIRRCREEDVADRFGSRSAAWLSGLEYAVPCLSQRLCEVADLGAFPAAFDPLQGDEEARDLRCLSPHCSGLIAVKKPRGMVFQVIENSKKRLARLSEFSV